jgi:magnesium-protoporphyrin O-methyltransferase
MAVGSYIERRGELETYFDRTAADNWAKLTSDAPVSGIRATVRAGRDEMRNTLLSWLPADMTGTRLLDAGCGTGTLSIEAARRGANVLAIDLSATLVNVARERLPEDVDPARIDFRSGDMLDPALGEFDFVVAMDSLIHYLPHDICKMLSTLASRTRRSMAVTFAPKTPLLTMMHFVGGFFPRADRAPAIEPISEKTLLKLIAADSALTDWRPGRTHRVSRGFYTSQALEMVRR